MDAQFDPANLNSVILNSPLLRTVNHFPRISLSLFGHRLLRATAISGFFSFPIKVLNSEVEM